MQRILFVSAGNEEFRAEFPREFPLLLALGEGLSYCLNVLDGFRETEVLELGAALNAEDGSLLREGILPDGIFFHAGGPLLLCAVGTM